MDFFSQLITSFGYTPKQSLLYGTPGGAVEIVFLVACGYLGDKYRNRILISSTGMITAIIGVALIVGLPLENIKGRLAGYYPTQASPTPFVCLLSLISSNVAGYTKKTTVAAMYLIAYCVGNIIGPQTFRPQDAPRYIPGVITILACYCVCVCIILFIYFWCRRQNVLKAKIRAQPGYEKLENQEWLDLTDRENPEFVYSLQEQILRNRRIIRALQQPHETPPPPSNPHTTSQPTSPTKHTTPPYSRTFPASQSSRANHSCL
ncbi:unnamed protein product [Zymoseptoria tritici ST99CH_1A5]|uniref:Major facilitator superfamily (MFS) profile domain-containing protein n=1 Tax=Zymoseptoria tritici ST99CH_1A5 TaxID=1276529 RepID=A0A1Y6LM53_ZYMTR|nr:unnamed protein product [Zymoseptoria tritici ST99CH_1A5]